MHNKFTDKFPQCWANPGVAFDGDPDRIIWTGEGSTVNGEEAFNLFYYPETFGVHPKIVEWAENNNLYFEAYDNGTVIGYEC